jgi:hypothetical protein
MGINEIRNKQAEQTEMCECAPLTLEPTPFLIKRLRKDKPWTMFSPQVAQVY